MQEMSKAFCAIEANVEKMPCVQMKMRNRELSHDDRAALMGKMRSLSRDVRGERDEMYGFWCGAEDGEKAKDENSICPKYFASRRKSEL